MTNPEGLGGEHQEDGLAPESKEKINQELKVKLSLLKLMQDVADERHHLESDISASHPELEFFDNIQQLLSMPFMSKDEERKPVSLKIMAVKDGAIVFGDRKSTNSTSTGYQECEYTPKGVIREEEFNSGYRTVKGLPTLEYVIETNPIISFMKRPIVLLKVQMHEPEYFGRPAYDYNAFIPVKGIEKIEII